MSAKQHPERGIIMEMNKNKISMSDMLLTYISNRQEVGVHAMFEAMHTYGLIDACMWAEWGHLEDLLGRINIAAKMDSPDFTVRAKMFVQVLDEAKQFDAMDKAHRYSHLMKYGIDPFGSD